MCIYNLGTSLNKERNVHMKMNKKTKVILMTTLIATLSIFGSSTYGISKQSNLKPAEDLTYSINSEVIQSESKQIADSIVLADEKPVVIERQIVEKASQPAEIKDKQVISRGGSGLNTAKAQVKAQPKAQPKPVSKPQPKSTVTSVSVQADKEKDLFYRLVTAEAEAESFEGQLAVATVIMNRVKSPDYSNTITGVIMDKTWGYQFTPVQDGRINNPPSASAKKAVDMVLNGHRSFGADVFWFVNPRKATSPWIEQNKALVKTIGNHDFYR
jgi:spore germination cell wall hydrolase CwlJ-like protein